MPAKKINGEEFFVYSEEEVEYYWNCFFFCTQIPMNRVKESTNFHITVNGRIAPFATLRIDVPSPLNDLVNKQISLPVFIWRLNFPIYAINHTVIKIEHDDLLHPPIPEECRRYYERYKTKTHCTQEETNLGTISESEGKKTPKIRRRKTI